MSFEKFEKRFADASILVLMALGEAFQNELKEEKREFPRETERRYGRGKTGKSAGSPRDVVDSGKLLKSLLATIEANQYGVTAEYHYSVPYAALIYLGYGDVPPYPWIEHALKTFDFESLFKQAWDSLG